MKRPITLVLLLTLCFQTMAQNAEELRKYWNYRDNLTSKFLVVGTESGMSLPAAYRHDYGREIKWADNMITLGWYIGVLATEYHLLNSNQYGNYAMGNRGRVANNRYELYCALLALKRLDESAEKSFPAARGRAALNTDRNGFLIRDDVPSDFHKQFINIDKSLSDYSNANIYDKEMSQDQIYHILMGLALVKKFVPPGESHEGFNFVSEAKLQSQLISNYLSKNKWRIKNPLTKKKEKSKKLKHVDRGHQAYIFSGGLKKAVEYINDGNVNMAKNVSPFYAWYWKTLKRSWNPTYAKADNLHMVMSVAAAGNAWNKRTHKTLIKISHKEEWYAYPLIHQSIHEPKLKGKWVQKKARVDKYALIQILNAPENGVRSPYPDKFAHKWSNNMKYIRDLETQIHGRQHSGGRTYNGLDFMLLYNSYYITHYKR